MSAATVIGQPLSSNNREISHLRRLLGRRRARIEAGEFVVEGPTLLGEALEAGLVPIAVYFDGGAQLTQGVTEMLAAASGRGARLVPVAPGVVERVADTVTSQPVLTLMSRASVTLDEFIDGLGAGMQGVPSAEPGQSMEPVPLAEPGPVVVLAGVGDPGNAGTIIRSAEAFGAGGVVVCEGSVDPFSPKTVRSSAGSLFHVPLAEAPAVATVLDALAAASFVTVGLVAHGGKPLHETDLSGRIAVVAGNEAHGLSPDALERLDSVCTIPMVGRAESLNVAMATTLVCFEAMRQRSLRYENDGRVNQNGANAN